MSPFAFPFLLPSPGDTTPSKEDLAVTDRLTKAGELLGVTVLDHIIHGDCTNEVHSIREG